MLSRDICLGGELQYLACTQSRPSAPDGRLGGATIQISANMEVVCMRNANEINYRKFIERTRQLEIVKPSLAYAALV